MISCNEYLVFVRKRNEPIKEIKNFLFCTMFGKIATMNNNISCWKINQQMMFVVSI